MIFTGSVAESFEKEMGYTHKEFLDNLPAAMKDASYQLVSSDHIEIPIDAGQLTIRLGEQQLRQVGLLKLPYMLVRFDFSRVDENSRTSFYRAFQRSYQKGGG